jgi:hypothetical protein
MKKIKYILYGLIIIALTIILIGFIVRYPYTIQITGKLYIINKKKWRCNRFDLHSGIATVAINIESHGAAKVVGQDKIAIANYNTTKDRDISICILNTTIQLKKQLLTERSWFRWVIALPQSNRIAVMSSISNTFNRRYEVWNNRQQNPYTTKESPHRTSQSIAYITNIESGSISVINYATSQIMETISVAKAHKVLI